MSANVDFFVSHASSDQSYAIWVDQVLRSAKYSTITDHYDFRPGENFILAMDQALERANQVILVWSKAAKDRYFVEKEWSAAIAGKSDRVLPLRIDDQALPSILSSIIYIDLGAIEDSSVAERTLLEGVRGRNRPMASVPFPGAQKRTTSPEGGSTGTASAREGDASTSMVAAFAPRSEQPSFIHRSDDVQEVWMAAKGFESFIHDNGSHLEALVSRGVHLRLMMHDPNDEKLMLAMAAVSYGNRDSHAVSQRLHSALAHVRKLIAGGEGRVHARLTAWPLYSGYTFFDPLSRKGHLYWELFLYRASLAQRLGAQVSRQHTPELFELHRQLFERQWKDAKPVTESEDQ